MHSCHLLFDHFQFILIHGPNIPGSSAVLFFTALDHHQPHPPTGNCFHFGSISFGDLRSSIFQCYIVFSYCLWGSQSFSSGRFLRTLHHDLSIEVMSEENCPVSLSFSFSQGCGPCELVAKLSFPLHFSVLAWLILSILEGRLLWLTLNNFRTEFSRKAVPKELG